MIRIYSFPPVYWVCTADLKVQDSHFANSIPRTNSEFQTTFQKEKKKERGVVFQVSILKVNPTLCQKGPLRYMGKSQTLCIMSRCIQASASPNPKGAPNPTYFTVSHLSLPAIIISLCPMGQIWVLALSQVVLALFFLTHFCFQYPSLLHACVYIF